MSATAPDPLMLRVYKGDKKGATAFFRNRVFLKTFCDLLATIETPRVLFQACSIGAEPYSFAASMMARNQPCTVDATDIEPDFVSAAAKGVYPESITTRMTDDEKHDFEPLPGGTVCVAPNLHKAVHFLPAQSLLDPMPGRYDVVFAMNVLTYLSPADQTCAIQNLAAGAQTYLCLTAFHPDTIKSDVDAAGFEPVMDAQAEIHNAWGDRVRAGGAQPGTPEYSWVVPPYNQDFDDYAWRYCAIFKRKLKK